MSRTRTRADIVECNCGARWWGRKIEHCTGCHESFSSPTIGDGYRVGDHAVSEGPDRRCCLTVGEMGAKGWQQAPNVFGQPLRISDWV